MGKGGIDSVFDVGLGMSSKVECFAFGGSSDRGSHSAYGRCHGDSVLSIGAVVPFFRVSPKVGFSTHS